MVDNIQQLYSLLVEQDELTWKDILLDLIRTEQMDPWDIDVGKLAQKYLAVVKKIKSLDLKVSGKVILAAALLLKIKSKRLVGADLDEFDRLLSQKDAPENFYEELETQLRRPEDIPDVEKLKLIPRMPQPRQRKVSIYDLIGALEQALEVKRRRILRHNPELTLELPKKKQDIGLLIKRVYKQVLEFFTLKKVKRLTFSQLLSKADREEKVLTFIPLLYLANQNKLHLKQEQAFGEIDIIPERLCRMS